MLLAVHVQPSNQNGLLETYKPLNEHILLLSILLDIAFFIMRIVSLRCEASLEAYIMF